MLNGLKLNRHYYSSACASCLRALLPYILCQAHLTLADVFSERPDEAPGLPSQTFYLARSAWLRSCQRTTVSPFQRVIFASLQSLGLSPRLEATTADGLLSIDVVLRWRGVPVAIECNGPHHYTRDGRPMGAMQWKESRLRARGLAVVNIAWHEWQALGAAAGELERGAFLMRRLQQRVLFEGS